MKATEMRRKRHWRSYCGVEQKSLHVKMYYDVLENLDKEAAVDGMPRNQLINQACDYYCKQLDEEREGRIFGAQDKCTPTLSSSNQATVELTQSAWENLQHIARGRGYSVDLTAGLLLERAIIEYDSRPFSFL